MQLEWTGFIYRVGVISYKWLSYWTSRTFGQVGIRDCDLTPCESSNECSVPVVQWYISRALTNACSVLNQGNVWEYSVNAGVI